jgi:hypothetical protein
MEDPLEFFPTSETPQTGRRHHGLIASWGVSDRVSPGPLFHGPAGRGCYQTFAVALTVVFSLVPGTLGWVSNLPSKYRSIPGELAMFHQLAERGFRYADELDYSVRRWMIADHPSRRRDGLLSELQLAIGRRLQAEYDLAQPIPARLAALVRDFERSG